uniref:AT3G11780 protein n=1 Tax=Arabidopsis thaliana TaxID=3702 RepID=C0Z3I8_ARATH|nr:AT3G11780 [Arabidopsis thaliana]
MSKFTGFSSLAISYFLLVSTIVAATDVHYCGMFRLSIPKKPNLIHDFQLFPCSILIELAIILR